MKLHKVALFDKLQKPKRSQDPELLVMAKQDFFLFYLVTLGDDGNDVKLTCSTCISPSCFSKADDTGISRCVVLHC